jgi:hypothetical protein
VRVQQVVIGVVDAERLDLRGVVHPRGLDHPAAGPAGGLLAVRRTLVAVQLEQREAAEVGRRGDLVERRVHEHAGQLDAPVELRADGLRLLHGARPRAPWPEDHAERPRAQLDGLVGVLQRRQSADLHAGHGPPMVAES